MADDKQEVLLAKMTPVQKAAAHKLLETAAIAVGAIPAATADDDTVTKAHMANCLKAIDEAKLLYS